MGVANEWNLWVWLECIGVVSGCCCMQVYRYPHNIIITYISYTPLVLALFLTAASLLLCSFLNVYVLAYVNFVQYSKRSSKNIRVR